MKSIKPGRGPSKMGVAGSIFAVIFGIFWCLIAASMGALIMIPFGLLFIGIAIYQAIYHYYNATSDDRYSLVDIVDSDEETDPLNEKYSHKVDRGNKSDSIKGTSVAYCPYCGKPVDGDFDFCPKCGNKLPD